MNDLQPVARPEPEARPTHAILFGPDGLRTGWRLLLFIAVLACLLIAANMIGHHFRPPAPNHQASGPHEQAPRSVFLGAAIPFLAVALATWIMSRIERCPATTYGGEDDKREQAEGGGTEEASRAGHGLAAV